MHSVGRGGLLIWDFLALRYRKKGAPEDTSLVWGEYWRAEKHGVALLSVQTEGTMYMCHTQTEIEQEEHFSNDNGKAPSTV